MTKQCKTKKTELIENASTRTISVGIPEARTCCMQTGTRLLHDNACDCVKYINVSLAKDNPFRMLILTGDRRTNVFEGLVGLLQGFDAVFTDTGRPFVNLFCRVSERLQRLFDHLGKI
jgi:hypothetical protein